ncbi:hypothetical protein H4R18_000626 [Coemansia javaensis]|uniref:Ubiquitin-like domain-containing protein n=1 Tax=Coemansia javaensis TaxID=2761396 RepID=A0A9W8HG98_9FUNG|nr:hypothetical protein H4R18_000626 [Coemansia javaensis]
MATDLSFFDATLAQLAQLPVQRVLAADTRVPAGARYPPKHFDFKMPAIQVPLVPSEEQADYFSLTFKTLKAPVRKFTLHVSSVRTVAQVKRHLSRLSNIPADSMRLVLGGKGLVDTKLIGDYAIPDGAVIQIISKPTGALSPAPSEQEQPEQPEQGAGALAAAELNPLSSALSPSGGQKPTQAAAAAAVARAAAEGAGDATDASSDGEQSTALDDSTRSLLRQKNGAFRNNLRELLHAEFGSSQADAVDRLLDSYFASL